MDNFVGDGIFIDSPAEKIFAGLLDPEDILVWMDAEEVRIDPVEGGEISVRRFDGSTVTGVLRNLKPGESLDIADYHWEKAGCRRGPMLVRFTIEPRHGGHWVTVCQENLDCPVSGGEVWQTFARGVQKEWVAATVALKRHIDGI